MVSGKFAVGNGNLTPWMRRGLTAVRQNLKVREWQAQQRDFVRQAGLTRDYFRERAGKQNLEIPKRDDIIKAQLKDIGAKGVINIPPRTIDIESLGINNQHANIDRCHGVTETEARRFIKNALVSTTKWDGMFEKYNSYDGMTYVDIAKHEIRTAFKPDEFRDYITALMEVLQKMGYDAPEQVMCPLVDRMIDAGDCLENRDVVDGGINPLSMPSEYKQKPDWEEICRQCKWHNY